MELRLATRADASAIALLHANSWRFAYRGALSDGYLDNEADRDRLEFWTQRLDAPAHNQHVFVLREQARLIGFASVYVDQHDEFGSFLNNLHVAQDCLRQGHGARLMSAVRECCSRESPASPVYLWVLESNRRARAFYSRLGASFRAADHWTPPGGGSVMLHRLAWSRAQDIGLMADSDGRFRWLTSDG